MAGNCAKKLQAVLQAERKSSQWLGPTHHTMCIGVINKG
jgi:hypothetical protein